MVNRCSGKMGKAIIQAANSAGLTVVPVSFGSAEESGQTVQVGTNEILVHGPHERESTLASLFQKYPNLIVVDFTVPSAVNNNAELYCKVGVPLVMGTLPRLLFLASRSWGCPLMWNSSFPGRKKGNGLEKLSEHWQICSCGCPPC
ncbi:unnamed protein product [Malus baccata var. baccata]